MSNFVKIVRNYETISRIGREIINHKDFIRHTAPTQLDKEFQKQEERIEKFINAANAAQDEWEKNEYSINEYWTGLS